MNTGVEKATEERLACFRHRAGGLTSERQLEFTLTLIFEHQMVSDYTHPGKKGNMITNMRNVIKEETVCHNCASLHKTLVYIHDARCVCAGSRVGHLPGPAKAAYFLDKVV